MSRWLDRTGYIALFAFVGGGLIATVIVLIIVLARGGGDDGETVAGRATPTSATAPLATALDGTPTARPATTPTPGVFADPEDALAAFVQDQLGAVYIGPCPDSLAPDEQLPEGFCSILLYESAELATYNVGRYGAEALGEAVVVPAGDGTWSLTFLEFPPLDAQIAVGADAIVFQAEDCLRFRASPSTSAQLNSCQIDGTRARVSDGPVEAEGITWWQLEGYGWASAEYLAPVAQ